jgi:hypothetical protein
MRKLLQAGILILLVLVPSIIAKADTIDFKAMAESAQWGESAWNNLTITTPSFTVTITGTKNSSAAFAYLDSGGAGLGVCGGLLSGSTPNIQTQSNVNLCNPSDDDNVTSGEFITMTFNKDVIIQTLWFNDNHDGDTSLLNNSITIGGSNFLFANGGAGLDSSTTNPYFVAAGTAFKLSYVDEEFYLSKMTASAVPEPSTIVLAAIGLLGLGVIAKRRQSLNRRPVTFRR